ncbi:MAG TPA: hypothetical protein VMR81_03530 [Patescibacteria group bacterium]|nr:hypothetical protein [Patescibacteria group bacterium]
MIKSTADSKAHKQAKLLAVTVVTLGVLILLAVATVYGNFSLTSFARSRNANFACRNGKCLTSVTPNPSPSSTPKRKPTPPSYLKDIKNQQIERQNAKSVYMPQSNRAYLTPSPTITTTP